MRVADKVRAYREDTGYTQRELAERAGVNVLQVKRWEAGEAVPSVRALARLSDVLGVTLDGLVWADSTERRDDRWSALIKRAEGLGTREVGRIQDVVLALVEHAERRAAEEDAEKREPASARHSRAKK